jgi:uncharacterized protein (DUF849 family)
VPLGVTTGAWSTPDAASRLKLIESWTELPDFASVNWHEDGADEVATLLHERGVGVEAGIWHMQGAHAWLASSLRGVCIRVLIEVQDIPPGAVEREALSLCTFVREASETLPILLHGEERSAWPALRLAARWGLETRIGLEDTVELPDGTVARGNAELVEVAMAPLSDASSVP